MWIHVRGLDRDRAVSNTNLVETIDLDMCLELSVKPILERDDSPVDDIQGLQYGSIGVLIAEQVDRKVRRK